MNKERFFLFNLIRLNKLTAQFTNDHNLLEKTFIFSKTYIWYLYSFILKIALIEATSVKKFWFNDEKQNKDRYKGLIPKCQLICLYKMSY